MILINWLYYVLYHASKNMLMQSVIQSDKVRDIQTLQESIGEEACKVMPLVHVLTGCGTTGSLLEKVNRLHFRASLSFQSSANGLATLPHPKMSAKKIRLQFWPSCTIEGPMDKSSIGSHWNFILQPNNVLTWGY